MSTPPTNKSIEDQIAEAIGGLKCCEGTHTDAEQAAAEAVKSLTHDLARQIALEVIGEDKPGVTNVMIAMEHNRQRTTLGHKLTEYLGEKNG